MAFQADAFQNDAFQIVAGGVGGAGAATFALDVEAGARVTLSWKTDITESISGLEQRASCRARPRQRYEWSSQLTDAQHRALLSTLGGGSAAAPLYLLALSYEDLTVVSSTTGSVTVHSVAYCDWAVSGQRIVVISPAGVVAEAVAQGTVGNAINVDIDLTAVAVEGARIMPAIGVYLDAEQAIGRHRAGAGRWDLAANAELNTSIWTVGTGATVNTYDGLPLWDWGIASKFASQPLRTGTELVDLGGRISLLSAFTVAGWDRALRITSHRAADWQWLKLFLHTVQGRRRKFLLPTGRPDLVPIGDASTGTLTIEGPPVVNAPDYVNDWFPSLAHRRLKLVKTDGTYAYREVTACLAGAGTQDLSLDSALAGALERVEFLEQVRLGIDDVTVTRQGTTFSSELSARVVQQ